MSKNINRIICNFFTSEIQATFVCNEIKDLANHFEIVNVYYLIDCNTNNFPKNVILHYVDYQKCNPKKIIQKYFPDIFKILIEETVSFPKFFCNISSIRYEISRLIRSFFLYDVLLNNLNSTSSKDFFYTYWFNDWAIVLSIAKSKNKINHYYSRAHGTDLYEDRVPVTKRIAFRKFQLQNVTKVFSVSKKGADYLKSKYPRFQSKIKCIYLGTKDFDVNPINKSKNLHIVSCATIRNIKRIHLIPDILKEIKDTVIWYHIGGQNNNDPTLTTLKEKIKLLPNNIKYEFKGAMSSEEVFEFYRSTPLDIFISVSETEGLPVSMMEAISFGIPIISTDVGGCDEIVTKETGALIPLNFDSVKVSELILALKESFNTFNSRNRVREFWKTKFSGESNFLQFLSEIRS